MQQKIAVYRADRVFTGNGQCLDGYAVAIRTDTGEVLDLLPPEEAPDALYQPGSLAPGFINAHAHLELSHLKDRFARHSGLVPFLEQVTRLRTADPEQIMDALRAAELALRLGGTVAVGDIVNTTDSLSVKLDSPLKFHTFVELFGMTEAGVQTGLQRGQPVLDAFRRAGMGASFSPHAPYSVHPHLLAAISQTAAGSPFSIHMQESPQEELLFRLGKGEFPGFYRRLGIAATLPAPGESSLTATLRAINVPGRLMLVHNTMAGAADLDQAAESPHDVWWCLCPGANLYIENRLPDVPLFRRYPERVLVGTDSLASNTGLSVLEELKILMAADPGLEPALAVQWASGNPARYFGWDDHLGSLEPGKSPGLVLIHPAADGRPIGPQSRSEVLVYFRH